MKINNNPRTRLSIVMWIAAIHSFIVGLGLIIQHPEIMKFFGFNHCMECFFPAQGGVFHIVMSFGYTLAAVNSDRFYCLVFFSIIVKLCATVFLFTYYITVESIWMILASGVQDAILFLMILYSFLSYQKWKTDSPLKEF